MKKVGIWIDKREAKVVSMKNGNINLDTIMSDVEDYHQGGGSGMKLKSGPQEVVLDKKFLEREKHLLAEYFAQVITAIEDAEDIVIFGPAQTGEKLHQEMVEKHPQFHDKTIPVKKADSMTENQIMAWVKNYYESVELEK